MQEPLSHTTSPTKAAAQANAPKAADQAPASQQPASQQPMPQQSAHTQTSPRQRASQRPALERRTSQQPAPSPSESARRATGATSRLRNSAIVFAGGACYGILASVVKLAYGAGFTFPQVVCSQAFFAFLVFSLLALKDHVCGKKRTRLEAKQRLKLAAMGVVTAGTTTFYYLSLTFIPASVAITLLFQFTWIGLVFEVATTRKKPANAAIAAAVVICVATLFASGLLGGNAAESLDPVGIACGLAAAVCCASFMFLSGRVEAHLPVQQRGLWASCGYLVVGFLLCPDYLTSGVLLQGIGWFGLILGPLGFAVPMMLFGIGCKHLSPGLSTIMASSELPISVICSVILLHEIVTPLQAAGVVAILAGVAIAQIPSKRTQSQS